MHSSFETPNILTIKHAIVCHRFVLLTSLLLFIFFASLYLFFAPGLSAQPWDSLSYAYSAETQGITALRGNHPLGHAIFNTIFILAKKLGYGGRALNIFQTVNGVLGGLTIATFFVFLIYIVKIKPQSALGFALVLGASYSFWFFAGTGDIYQFAILSSLLTWVSLIYEIMLRKRTFLVMSGTFTGLSILFHQLNVALIPVGLTLILLTPAAAEQAKKIKIAQTVLFIASATVTAGVGYLLLGFVATSSFSLTRVLGWMQGYFGDPTYGRYLDTDFFGTAWNTLSQRVLFSPQNKFQAISHGLLVFFLLLIPLGLSANKVLDKTKKAIMKASLLECLITWPLILWWEPQNPKFWLLMLLPWVIFLTLAFEATESSILSWLSGIGSKFSQAVIVLPVCLGVVIFALNLHYSGDSQDASFQSALDIWMNHSSPNDVLITAGDLVPHLLYWGKRPDTVYLYRSLQASQGSPDDFHDLREEINQAVCSRRIVLITPTASNYVPESQLSLVGVSREELHSFLEENAQKGKIAFWYRDLFDNKLLPVYAVKGSTACFDQKTKQASN